jgi:hypothetical protein
VELLHLQQLPDHHRFEHGADAARHDDERIGQQNEMMKAREEGAVLEGFGRERVDVCGKEMCSDSVTESEDDCQPGMVGGVDGTRTRGLCRDRAAF